MILKNKDKLYALKRGDMAVWNSKISNYDVNDIIICLEQDDLRVKYARFFDRKITVINTNGRFTAATEFWDIIVHEK